MRGGNNSGRSMKDAYASYRELRGLTGRANMPGPCWHEWRKKFDWDARAYAYEASLTPAEFEGVRSKAEEKLHARAEELVEAAVKIALGEKGLRGDQEAEQLKMLTYLLDRVLPQPKQDRSVNVQVNNQLANVQAPQLTTPAEALQAWRDHKRG